MPILKIWASHSETAVGEINLPLTYLNKLIDEFFSLSIIKILKAIPIEIETQDDVCKDNNSSEIQ
jgi:hypothetical protein